MDLTKALKIDSVSRLTLPAPLRIQPSETVSEAVKLMRQARVGCVLVCDGEQMVGILTERDLMRRVLAVGKPLTTLVRDCMTPAPVLVHCKETIGAAIRRMEEGGYRHLPVLDEAGRVVGVLAAKQIIRYLAEYFP